MFSNLKKLSVVTICLKDFSGLIRTCESVDRQTAEVYEHLLIVSGFSELQTQMLRTQLSKENRKFFFDLDKSLYNAMNIGVRCATGDMILFLNSGDMFADETCASSILTLETDGDKCLAFSTLQKYKKSVYRRNPGKLDANGILSSPPHQGFVAPLDKDIRDRIYFDEKNLIGADTDWMRCCMSRFGFLVFEKDLCLYQLGGISSLPSRKAIFMSLRSTRYGDALKILLKSILCHIVGRERYFYIMSKRKGYEVIT